MLSGLRAMGEQAGLGLPSFQGKRCVLVGKHWTLDPTLQSYCDGTPVQVLQEADLKTRGLQGIYWGAPREE